MWQDVVRGRPDCRHAEPGRGYIPRRRRSVNPYRPQISCANNVQRHRISSAPSELTAIAPVRWGG